MVIDVQVGLVAEAHQPERFLARVLELRQRASTAEVLTVFVQHDGDQGDLAPGSPQWQLHPDLVVAEDDIVVRKRSADAFYGTRLTQVLTQHEVTEVVVAGYATEYCIDSTCRSALALGYDVVLAADGHSTFERDAAAATGGLSAAQAITHHNWVLATIAQPDYALLVLPTSRIKFSEGR